MTDSLKHPVFGKLRWDEKYSWWVTKVRLPSNGKLDVILNPDDEEGRFAFVEVAAKLYRRAMKAERRILRDAIREELLELYNGTWRQDAPRLTAAKILVSWS